MNRTEKKIRDGLRRGHDIAALATLRAKRLRATRINRHRLIGAFGSIDRPLRICEAADRPGEAA